jgi:voltage-gated sodium channel
MVSLVPELRLLINSLLKALPQITYVLLLLFIIFYIYGALGSTLFHNINEERWGNIGIAMLTLFEVMTFEGWSDIMYETMRSPEGTPWAWIYYLSFIFLTAFVFLNMIIGVVLYVMQDEHHKLKERSTNKPSLEDLQQQIRELKVLLENNQR